MSVLVTGATAGFGCPTARRFAQAGLGVVAAASRREPLRPPADERGARGRTLEKMVQLMPVRRVFGPLFVHRTEENGR